MVQIWHIIYHIQCESLKFQPCKAGFWNLLHYTCSFAKFPPIILSPQVQLISSSSNSQGNHDNPSNHLTSISSPSTFTLYVDMVSRYWSKQVKKKKCIIARCNHFPLIWILAMKEEKQPFEQMYFLFNLKLIVKYRNHPCGVQIWD